MPAHDHAPYRTQNWSLTKPVASGRHGLVVAQNREAAEAGAAILAAGGNAADAAVATAFALAAVEPWNSGLGGIGFALVLPPGASGRRSSISGRSRAATPGRGLSAHGPDEARPVHLAGGRGRPQRPRPLSFCIPSAVAGYGQLHDAFGTGGPVAPSSRRPCGSRAGGSPRTGSPRSRSPPRPRCCGSTRRAPGSTCRAGCRRWRPTRARPASCPSDASPTRWSGWRGRACGISTRARSPPISSPTSRRSAASSTGRTWPAAGGCCARHPRSPGAATISSTRPAA